MEGLLLEEMNEEKRREERTSVLTKQQEQKKAGERPRANRQIELVFDECTCWQSSWLERTSIVVCCLLACFHPHPSFSSSSSC